MAHSQQQQQAQPPASRFAGFTFHLPNVWARQSHNAYEALPRDAGDDEDHSAAAAHGAAVAESEGAMQHGAEATQEWRALSATGRLSVYAAFGVLGAAVLLPFNTLITPSEYYRALLAGSAYEASFMSWIVLTYNAGTIVFGAHATATLESTTPLRRMLRSGITVLAALVLLATYVFLHQLGPSEHADDAPKMPRADGQAVFPALLAVAAVMAAATAYLQSAVVALSSTFGARPMGLMLAGQGVVGLGVSLIQLFATLAARAETRSALAMGHKAPDSRLEARDSAVVFFIWSAVFMLLSLVVIVLLSRSALYRAVSARQARARELASPANAPLSVGSDPRTAGWEEGKGFGRYIPRSMRDGAARIRSVQSQVIAMSVCIAWCFVVTLALFPALTSRVRPWPSATPPEEEPTWRDPLVFVALHYVLFNASDLVGRMLPTLLPGIFLLEARRAIIFWSGMREGFLGLIPLCNVSHAAAETPGPGRRAVVAAVAVVASAGRKARFGDATFFALMVLLGLSNGVLSTSIFISGPKRPGVKEDERPLAATIISFWLTVGLALGSGASFLWAR